MLLLYYLTRKKQRLKIGSSFSYIGVILIQMCHKGQSLALFYSIYLSVIQFFSIKKSEVCNFAVDSTVFCSDKNLDLVFSNLSSNLSNVMDWFKINYLKANP